MKHATDRTIERLYPLLTKLRTLPGLTEKKTGIYYRKSKAFLHFHEDGDLIFADVRLSGKDFERLPCTTKKEQTNLYKSVQQALLS